MQAVFIGYFFSLLKRSDPPQAEHEISGSEGTCRAQVRTRKFQSSVSSAALEPTYELQRSLDSGFRRNDDDGRGYSRVRDAHPTPACDHNHPL